jgi:hypothetical protein
MRGIPPGSFLGIVNLTSLPFNLIVRALKNQDEVENPDNILSVAANRHFGPHVMTFHHTLLVLV